MIKSKDHPVRRSREKIHKIDIVKFCEEYLGIKLLPYQKVLLKILEGTMGEYDPFFISEMDKEILDIFIKHGYGSEKMYENEYFRCNLSDETACLTLAEFAEKCATSGTWSEDAKTIM